MKTIVQGRLSHTYTYLEGTSREMVSICLSLPMKKYNERSAR